MTTPKEVPSLPHQAECMMNPTKFLTEPLILRGYNLHDHVFKQLIIVIPCMSDTLLVIRPPVFYGHLLTSTTVALWHYKAHSTEISPSGTNEDQFPWFQ